MNPRRLLLVSSCLAALLSVAAETAAAADATPPPAARGGRGGGGRGQRASLPPERMAALTGGKEIPPGPVQPTWESVREHYVPPAWFTEAKFGIFMHWGLYSVAAHHNEWWVQHMYSGGADTRWQIEKYGPLDKFGYKDYIPLFTAEKWDPDAWAALFKEAGAGYVMPTAEHHDGWANWDSALTKWDAKDMGPHRDLIGDLAKAVRAAGLHFGVSNHRIEHYTFIRPPADLPTDLFEPELQDFYWVANHGEDRYAEFLETWLARNFELIDKYQPDLLYFDNGVNSREFDPLKLRVAAYYYNRAAQWGKQVSINTKRDAYLAGSIHDYERGRAPDIRPDPWQEDTSIAHNTWCYTDDIIYRNAGELIRELVDCVSKNGNYLLNICPKGDGTIPEEQQLRLLQMGEWLRMNGEAIYASRPWVRFGEGPTEEAPSGERGIVNGMLRVYTPQDMRFTTRDGNLYAILFAWPADGNVVVKSLAQGGPAGGEITGVSLLGSSQRVEYSRDPEGLKVKLPVLIPCEHAYVLKITGLNLP